MEARRRDRALVRGDVDPHGNGLGARKAHGGAVVVEVSFTAPFETIGRGVNNA